MLIQKYLFNANRINCLFFCITKAWDTPQLKQSLFSNGMPENVSFEKKTSENIPQTSASASYTSMSESHIEKPMNTKSPDTAAKLNSMIAPTDNISIAAATVCNVSEMKKIDDTISDVPMVAQDAGPVIENVMPDLYEMFSEKDKNVIIADLMRLIIKDKLAKSEANAVQQAQAQTTTATLSTPLVPITKHMSIDQARLDELAQVCDMQNINAGVVTEIVQELHWAKNQTSEEKFKQGPIHHAILKTLYSYSNE